MDQIPSQELRRLIIRHFMRLFVPLLILFTSFVYVANDIHKRLEISEQEENATRLIELQTRAIFKELTPLVADLQYLSQLEGIQQSFDQGVTQPHSKELLAFSSARSQYSQIRLINTKGMEILRINKPTNSEPKIAPKDQLQNKAKRYYFSQTLKLPKGQIYVSPLDLNQEHDQIEIPFNPTIRFGTPIYSKRGKLLGTLVINYAAKELLEGVRDRSINLSGRILLTNKKGYFLIGMNGEAEWGHVIPERSRHTMAKLNLQAWQDISANAEGHIYSDDQLFTYSTVDLSELAQIEVISADAPQWKIITHMTIAEMIPEYEKLLSSFIIGMVLIVLLLALGSYWHAREKAEKTLVSESLSQYKTHLEQLVEDKTNELIRSEAHYRAVVENELEGILIVAKGVIRYANPRLLELSGYLQEELEGKPQEELFHALGGNPHISFIAGQKIYEGSLTTIKGANLPIEFYSIDFQYREQEAQLIFIRDVSAKKASEVNIKRLTMAIEQSPVSILITDTKGNIEYVNPKLLELTGYQPEELIGKNPRIFKSGHQPPNLYKELWNNIAGGQEWSGEFLNKKKNRSLFWEKVFISPIFDLEGRIINYLAVKEDITEKKQQAAELKQAKEAAEASSRAKADFLATMSHEIRTPMNGLIGMLSLLKDTELNVEQRQYINTMQVSGENLLHIINDILDFSKIEAGKLRLEHKPVDLRNCIEETFGIFSITAAEKKLELNYHLAPNVPEVVVSDETRLKQILMNLIGNAVKFTPHGEIFVSISMGPTVGSKLEIRFAVKDSGMGIEAGKMEYLFKAFTQADSSTTRKFGGTGLGLAISRRLAEMMDGSMWAESSMNQGSTFYFTVQAQKLPENVKSQDRESYEPLGNKRLLVISPNQHILDFWQEVITPWGLKSILALNKQAAKELLDQEIDLAIIDGSLTSDQEADLELHSDVMSLRRIFAEKKIPVLLLKHLKTNANKEPAQEEGPGYTPLFKPLKQNNVYVALRTALGLKSEQPQIQPPQPKLSTTLATELPMQILLVEDNPINLLLAEKIVTKLGYAPDSAKNGEEALEALAEKKYDLVFMDIQMPKMDGVTATKEIIRTYHDERPIIVAMTANAMAEDRDQYLEAGMDDYIAKPIHPETIQICIEKWGKNNLLVQSLQPEPQLSEDELLDLETLEGRKQLGGGFIHRFIQAYFEQVDQLLPEIEEAIHKGDYEEIMQKGHMLKGCSANVGAAKLANLGKTIQFKGEDENPHGLDDILEEVRDYYQETKNSLREFLQNCEPDPDPEQDK